MSNYLGDFKLGDTLDTKFQTLNVSAVPTTLAGSPVVSVYSGNSTTESATGVTLTVDFDSRTGTHNVRVVASAGNGFAAGTNYQLVITTGTVNGVSVVGQVIAEFSIENRVLNLASTPILTGPYPAFDIIDSGTAQAATSTTIQLRAAATFADSVGVGGTILVFGSTQGYWQTRSATQNVGSTDTFTVDAWDVTPSGTITYILFGTPPGSASALRTALGLAAANLDSQIAAVQTTANALVVDTTSLKTRVPAALDSNGNMKASMWGVRNNLFNASKPYTTTV